MPAWKTCALQARWLCASPGALQPAIQLRGTQRQPSFQGLHAAVKHLSQDTGFNLIPIFSNKVGRASPTPEVLCKLLQCFISLT